MPTENRSNNADGWIACDDGLHLIQMDKNLSHYGWVFRKVDGGLAYSVREATPHEMAHAQARQHLRIGVAQIAGQAPAPQPHPEPIAWMVGTAIWWTKEEAERDAAATGLPIVGLGPMTDRTATELAESETMAAIAELAECEAMADMVAEREWAEHVGTGDVSSKVEAAFTQLHNDLHEAGEKLAERDTLLRLVRDGNGYLDEQDWERINAITEHGSGEAIQSQHVSYERLLRDVATELREPSSVGWEDDMASRIDVALARKPS